MSVVSRKIFILLITLLAVIPAVSYSQSAFINTEQGIYQLTGGPGSCERVLVSNGCGSPGNILSLAVYKDTIYYLTWGGELKRFRIGDPSNCETLIDGGPSYNAMTVDKNGIIYLAQDDLATYNPYTNEFKVIGRMPYFSSGDIIFFNDKLLLAGYDPDDWSPDATGIFEINPADLASSKRWMTTPDFIGLIAYPTACGSSRYFGVSCHNTGSTQLTELDLVHKTIIGETCSMPLNILDGASITETGIDNKVAITHLIISKSCQSPTGTVQVNAQYPAGGAINFTLDNNITNNTGFFSGLNPGQHHILVSAAGGACTTDTLLTISSSYHLIDALSVTHPDNCLNIQGSVHITAAAINAPLTFTLLNSGLSQSSGDFTNLRGGRYNFRIEDAAGCSQDTSIAIAEPAMAPCHDIFVPTAFTPNNDGRNDQFMVTAASSFKDLSLQVYNRWGTLVFQARGNTVAWDGTYKGSQQPVGVYIYNLNFITAGGEKKSIKGSVTLIR